MRQTRRIAALAGVALWFGLAAIATSPLAAADTPAPRAFTARVERVVDGDSVVVAVGSKRYDVRLSSIDAPESCMPHGDKATAALSAMVLNKPVRIVPQGRDKYGRGLGVLWVGGKCVNVEMVRQGHAWWFRRYAPDVKTLADAEQDARKNRRGLWAAESPVAPREFRRSLKLAAKPKPTPNAGPNRPDTQTVFVTRTGSKYHREGCRHLSRSKRPISLNDASRRYSPCKVCRPAHRDTGQHTGSGASEGGGDKRSAKAKKRSSKSFTKAKRDNDKRAAAQAGGEGRA